MTVDFEDITSSNLISYSMENNFERINRSLELLLSLFKSFKVTATFFVVGQIAEKYSQLIEKIISDGHHIGSHSYSHSLIYNMKPSEFNQDLGRSIAILESIIGNKVDSFRAPSWSYSKKINDWYWDILKQNGVEIDSSIFPTKNFLYGEPDAPRFINKRDHSIIEVPPSTVKYFDKNIPFSGGFYFRLFPYWFVKKSILELNNFKQPAVIYIHPWELDSDIERIKDCSIKARFIMYYNVDKNIKKFEKLLTDFEFCSIEKYFKGN